MNVLDLFSGIGGFSLGLERAGMKTIAFCEIDPKCRQVLRKHWPVVPIYEDVRSLQAKDISETIDVICGGFPCQDISIAGKGVGLSGERSGLWWQFHRLINEAKPKWVIIENVSALRYRGLDEVLRSLFEVGYDAEWHCITAASIGAPHRRDRVWIVSYPYCEREPQPQGRICDERGWFSDSCEDVANTSSIRLQRQGEFEQPKCSTPLIIEKAIKSEHGHISSFWEIEPNVGRVANGVPKRMDRLKQLGNAVVPQIPEILGRSILHQYK